MKLSFKCPQCGKDKLEIIYEDASVGASINSIDTEDEIEYGPVTVNDCNSVYFQCEYCGYVVTNEEGSIITDDVALIEFLERKETHS